MGTKEKFGRSTDDDVSHRRDAPRSPAVMIPKGREARRLPEAREPLPPAHAPPTRLPERAGAFRARARPRRRTRRDQEVAADSGEALVSVRQGRRDHHPSPEERVGERALERGLGKGWEEVVWGEGWGECQGEARRPVQRAALNAVLQAGGGPSPPSARWLRCLSGRWVLAVCLGGVFGWYVWAVCLGGVFGRICRRRATTSRPHACPGCPRRSPCESDCPACRAPGIHAMCDARDPPHRHSLCTGTHFIRRSPPGPSVARVCEPHVMSCTG